MVERKLFMKRIAVLLFSFLILLAGCSDNRSVSSSETNEDLDNKVVKIAWGDSGFPSPFTFTSNGPGGYLRSSFIFDSLTWKDETGVIPWLASSWEVSDDRLTYTFKLEDKVKFHDGESLTADDVVFTYNYFKKHAFQWNADISKVASVKKLTDSQVAITLNEEYSPFITEIAGILPILPEHIWSKVDNPIEYTEKEALIGTGPYTLNNYNSSTGNYRYLANKDYFKGDVSVPEVQYLNVENKMLSLQKGEISGGMTFNYTEVKQMEKQGYKALQSDPTGSAVRIVFNLENEQLNDKRLRQAIAYALNRGEIAEKVLGNPETLIGSGGVIPPDSEWANNKVKQYDYDLSRANKILDDLGYEKNKNGVREKLSLSVLVSSTPQEAELMKSMLSDVGIQLDIQTVDTATFTTAMSEGKYDMAITGHIGLSGDPDFLRLWFSGQASNAYAGNAVFNHDEFSDLASLQLSQEGNERKKTVNAMQDILADELPTLVIYHRPFYFVYDATVFDGWFNTAGGISDGIPLTDNKAAFIDYD